MNVNNFLVRPRRRWVEKFARDEAWTKLGEEDKHELEQHVAGLPSEVVDEDEEAKRFDLLVLRLQLCVLRGDDGFERWRERVRAIAGLLEEKASIPMVRAELALIQEIQTDDYWQDVTVPMLESARRRLRALVKLIEKARRQPVYTDFEDELGHETEVALPDLAFADLERFRDKARRFLREHEGHPAVRKLRGNEPLAPGDLDGLEHVFLAAGVGTAEDLLRAKQETRGFGLLVRSLVGLDRDAVRDALARFLTARTVTADQLEFLDLVVAHLVQHGFMDPGLLYDSPFTDVHPRGPEGLFSSEQVDELVAVLAEIRGRAA